MPGSFPRDGNFTPITQHGMQTIKDLTLSGNNATVAAPIFTVTGAVKLLALYGVVTTVLGANNTAAFWRLNDQSAQPAISLATGTTLSAAKVGSVIERGSVAGVALTLADAAAGRVIDPVAATAPDVFMPFAVVQKVGGILTQIEFVYSTTDTPTTGVIRFFAGWVPLSSDGNLVAA